MRHAQRYYHWLAAALILLQVVGVALTASALNFPPIAKATPMPEEVFLGGPILFSSAESIDPDEGPQPLTYQWDFGDGTTSTEGNPTHAYAEPRAYRVSLTVSDGADSAIDSVIVHVLAPPTPVPPGRSSLLALNPAGTELWVANPDANSVSVLSVRSNTVVKVAEIAVGRHPRTLAFSRDGRRVLVTCQGVNELWVVDAAGSSVAGRISVGHQPYGVAVSSDDGKILVSNQGDATVSVISPAFIVKKILRVADIPRALAITADGRFGYVTHFLTRGVAGAVTEIDLADLHVARTSTLLEDMSPDTTSSGGTHARIPWHGDRH